MMPSSLDTIAMIEDSPTEAQLNLWYLHGEKCRIVHGATARPVNCRNYPLNPTCRRPAPWCRPMVGRHESRESPARLRTLKPAYILLIHYLMLIF